MTAVTRETYQQVLDTLRADVCSIGELVAERFDNALDSLATGDEPLARAVIDGDGETNDRSLGLETECVDLFALQQPVASDLRFVTASFKIITDPERIGDLAVNLAQYALAAKQQLVPEVAVEEIGRDGSSMLERSLAAYDAGEPDTAREIVAGDDTIDEHCRAASENVTRHLIEREADGDGPSLIEQLLDDVTRLLLTIRDIERVADHAVNIAARTLYLVENDPELTY